MSMQLSKTNDQGISSMETQIQWNSVDLTQQIKGQSANFKGDPRHFQLEISLSLHLPGKPKK